MHVGTCEVSIFNFGNVANAEHGKEIAKIRPLLIDKFKGCSGHVVNFDGHVV